MNEKEARCRQSTETIQANDAAASQQTQSDTPPIKRSNPRDCRTIAIMMKKVCTGTEPRKSLFNYFLLFKLTSNYFFLFDPGYDF
jgi:hypothetical protein